MTYELPKDCALVLRACSDDMSSRNGFFWPGVGGVAEAPDWKPVAECGNGLHGWLYGCGDHDVTKIHENSKWLIVEVEKASIIELGGKVKFPRGKVVFVGERVEAVKFLQDHEPECKSRPVLWGVSVVGDGVSAIAGYKGTATAGHYGTATAGRYGTATAGHYGTATAGEGGTATAGHYGTATAGEGGTATAGYYGTATAGHYGTATAGEGGTATAGYYGTATAGRYGTATAGEGGTATAGEGGTIHIWHHDGDRRRLITGYIGEDGILPNVAYKVVNGKLERA